MTDPTPDVTPADRIGEAGPLVASPEDNRALEHTDGGQTTRSDATDLGVPMLAGQADEPVGPEDAFGRGPKRGDYSGRAALEGPHTETVAIPEAERMQMAKDLVKEKGGDKAIKAGFTVGVALGEVPRFRSEDQVARTLDVGDSPGKGGVSTAEARGVTVALDEK